MAQQPRKGRDHPDVQAMQAQRDRQNKANEAAMKRMDESKPTPTQEENDLAKLGIMVDEKEDDGSGPTVIRTVVVANQPLPVGGYEPPNETLPADEQARKEQRDREKQQRDQQQREQRQRAGEHAQRS